MTAKIWNRRPARLVMAIYLISCVQFLCPACTSRSGETSGNVGRTGRGKAGTDPSFLAVMGLKRPSLVLRRVIALAVQADPRLSGVPADVFANAVQAGLTLRFPELEAIDLERPARVFLIRRSESGSTVVAAVPVTSAGATAKLMDRFFQKRPPSGSVLRHAWLGEDLFWKVKEGFLLISPNKRALARMERPVLAAAKMGEPPHDIQLRFWPSRILRMWGVDYHQVIDGAADLVRTLLAPESPGPLRSDPRGGAAILAREAVERALKYAADLESSGLYLDFSPTGFTFGIMVSARRHTALSRLFAAGRPGRPVGLNLIPKRSYFVFSIRTNPVAARRRMKRIEQLVNLVSGALTDASRQRLVSSVTELLRHAPGEFTLALHGEAEPKAAVPRRPVLAGTFFGQSPDGRSLRKIVLSMIRSARVLGLKGRDGRKSTGLDAFVGGLVFRAGTRRVGGFDVDSVQVSVRPRARPPVWARSLLGLDASGATYQVSMASGRKWVVLAVGRNAIDRVSSILTRLLSPGGKPRKLEGLAAELSSRPRSGWMALSLLDLIKETRFFGAKGTENWVKIASRIPSRGGVVLSWGAESKREGSVGLTWSVNHLIALSRYFGGQTGQMGSKSAKPEPKGMPKPKGTLKPKGTTKKPKGTTKPEGTPTHREPEDTSDL